MKIAKPINKNLFNLFLLFIREPDAINYAKELEFYTNGDNNIIGLISLDYIDNDYYAAIFIREKSKQFRIGNVVASLETIKEARSWIDNQMLSNSIIMSDNELVFFDLFKIIADPKQIHPYFEYLRNKPELSNE